MVGRLKNGYACLKKILRTFESWEIVLLVLLGIALINTTYFIFIRSASFWQSDTASMNVLAREQIVNRQFFPTGWVYVQDIWPFFVNIPIVLFSPFTNDQLLLRSMGVFIQATVMLLVLIVFSKHVFKNNSYMVYGTILFSFISTLYTDLMFSVATYGYALIKTLLAFMFLSISVDEIFKINKKYMILSSVMIAILSMNGVRHYGTIFIPLVASFGLVYIIDHQNETFKTVWLHLKKFITWGCLFILSILPGFIVYIWVLTNRTIISGATNPIILSFGEIDIFFNSLSLVIPGVWMHFGIENQAPLFSIVGVTNLIKHLSAIAFLIVLPILLTRQYKNEIITVKRMIIFSWSTLAITIVLTLFSLGLMQDVALIRYYSINFILQIILSSFYLYKYILKKSFLLCVTGFIAFLFVLFSFNYDQANYVYRNRHSREEYLIRTRELGDALMSRGLKMGYATHWNANNHSVLFNFDPKIAPVWWFDAYSHSLSPFLWLTSERFFHPDYHTGRTFLLLSHQEYEIFQSNINLQATLGEPEEIFEQSGYIIIVYSYNIAYTF